MVPFYLLLMHYRNYIRQSKIVLGQNDVRSRVSPALFASGAE